MSHATVKELFTYTDWARDKSFDLVRGLTDAQLDQPFEMGLGSVRKTLHHIWAVERVWLDRWSKGGKPPFVQPEAGLPTTALHERARATAAERDTFLATKAEDDMARPLTYTNIKGETYSLPLGGLMLHVCNHGIHHRAQLLNMIRRVGVALPQRGLDYVFFRLEQPASPPFTWKAIRDYLAYADWGTRKLLTIAAGLSDEQLDRSIEMGSGSLRATFVHLRDAENWWHTNWTAGPGEPWPPGDDCPSVDELSRQFEDAWSKRDVFSASLADADLQRTIHAQPRPDRRVSFPLGVTLVQLCGHATHHRAQMVNMLRHVGAETPALDYSLWMLSTMK